MTERNKYDFVDYSAMVPLGLAEGLEAYIEEGQEPGGFLYAVLTNDLFEAVGRADRVNRLALTAIVEWVYNEAPSTCWGSKERVKAWMEEHSNA